MNVFRSIFLGILFFQKVFAEIISTYNKENLLEMIQIKNHGRIEYLYNENKKVIQVKRLDEHLQIQYFVNYTYDLEGNISSETLISNLGTVYYNEKTASSPYHFEEYQEKEHQIIHTLDDRTFSYPQKTFSTKFNPPSTSADELIEFSYKNKKRIKTKNDRKIETYYEVNGEEIAIYDEYDQLIELKIPGAQILPGLSKPIAIEKEEKIYAVICDKFLNIFKLIDVATQEIFSSIMDPFGKNLLHTSSISRFTYRGKIFDPDLQVVYFGHRYYLPSKSCWLTVDPIGSLQNKDLYSYCNNQPWRYLDPDGRFYFVVPISGSPSFEDSLKTVLISFGLSLLTKELIEDCNQWLNKKADEHRMEEFVKMQKRKDKPFL